MMFLTKHGLENPSVSRYNQKPRTNFLALSTSLSYIPTYIFAPKTLPLQGSSWEFMEEGVEMDRYFARTSVFHVSSYATNGLHTSIQNSGRQCARQGLHFQYIYIYIGAPVTGHEGPEGE